MDWILESLVDAVNAIASWFAPFVAQAYGFFNSIWSYLLSYFVGWMVNNFPGVAQSLGTLQPLLAYADQWAPISDFFTYMQLYWTWSGVVFGCKWIFKALRG